jgi:hypothetical protein
MPSRYASIGHRRKLERHMGRFSLEASELQVEVVLHLTIFVVVAARNLNLPLPQQPTIINCTLNNGIHFVTTPDCRLDKNCAIEQEFELYV